MCLHVSNGVTLFSGVTLFLFLFFMMEEREAEEIFEWKVNEVKPERFVGQRRKNSWKSWKKKVKEIIIKKKVESEDLSLDNCVFLVEKGGKMKIKVRESELEGIWRKFHEDGTTGGHQGVNAMEHRILRGYYVSNLRKWLLRKVKECKICEQVRRKMVVPPSAPFLAANKTKLWQLDYIGKFPIDAKTGHR